MTNKPDEGKNEHAITQETKWGDIPEDQFGYKDKETRRAKRGLEDWEMLEEMEESQTSIPYWFVALFFLLLLIAVGLTFPFWGNRPGFERDWFDWGIPAGAAWVIVMSFLIYYMVDLRHVIKRKKEEKLKQQEQQKDK
ncbi:MAG: hypothetical protein OEW58_02850 [Gammaproteobacteria bacterium]|nr:hypothetical protein [Gammaproteobacteria bacterium]